jgi:hypothetical protein
VTEKCPDDHESGGLRSTLCGIILSWQMVGKSEDLLVERGRIVWAAMDLEGVA